MEYKKVSKEQWLDSLTKLKGFVEGYPYLEKKEFAIFENNCEFIMSNTSQFERLPIRDYYRSLEIFSAYERFHTAQSRYGEALKIAELFQDIADEIRGERKTKEEIKQKQEELFHEQIETLTSKYDDLVAKFDAFKKIDINANKLEAEEKYRNIRKTSKIWSAL